MVPITYNWPRPAFKAKTCTVNPILLLAVKHRGHIEPACLWQQSITVISCWWSRMSSLPNWPQLQSEIQISPTIEHIYNRLGCTLGKNLTNVMCVKEYLENTIINNTIIWKCYWSQTIENTITTHTGEKPYKCEVCE